MEKITTNSTTENTNTEQIPQQKEMTKEEKEQYMKEIFEKMKANPSNFENKRVSYKEELLKSLETCNYNFTDIFNSFLNYVNAKKGDDNSFFIKNELLNLKEKIDLTPPTSTDEKDKVNSDIINTYANIPLVDNVKAEQEKNSVPLIVDLANFIDNSSYQYGAINKELLDLYLHCLKNLGMLVILADMPTVLNLGEYVKEKISKEPKFSCLVKSASICNSPLMCLISIQKFELKTDTNFDNLKVQVSEFFDKKSTRFNKINDLTYIEYARLCTYIYQMHQISTILKKVSSCISLILYIKYFTLI